jgi:flagellar biosynthesis GTPase FlhF
MFSSQSIPTISETVSNELNIAKKITYYDITKELSITLAHGKKITEANVMAYTLSPLKNYLVVFKEKNAMYLINTKTGKKLDNIATNVITYCFSPDDKETRLVELGSPREFFTGQNILYSVVDLEKLSSSLTTFTVDNSFYFKSPNELVVISKDGAFTSYNPQTGISFKKEQQQKQQQVIQEINKKEEPKRKKEALQEQEQEIARRELAEEAKKREQEEREIISLRQKQEQELVRKAAEEQEQKKREIEEQEQDFKKRREYKERKAAEEQREQDVQKAYPVKEGSYFEQIKKFFWGK